LELLAERVGEIGVARLLQFLEQGFDAGDEMGRVFMRQSFASTAQGIIHRWAA